MKIFTDFKVLRDRCINHCNFLTVVSIQTYILVCYHRRHLFLLTLYTNDSETIFDLFFIFTLYTSKKKKKNHPPAYCGNKY